VQRRLEAQLVGEWERGHEVVMSGEVEPGRKDGAVGRGLVPLDPPAARRREQAVHRQPVRIQAQRRRVGSIATSRPATENRLRESRFAHGCRSGMPMVLRCATYASSPPRRPSSSSPRWRREQPTIPADGTNAASMPPAAALPSVNAGKPSTVRSPIISRVVGAVATREVATDSPADRSRVAAGGRHPDRMAGASGRNSPP
jgi:hypothetical protein